MAGTRKKQITLGNQAMGNRRKAREPFAEVFRTANARAHERTNRRLERADDWKHIRASIAATDTFDDTPGTVLRLFRWLLAALLLPVCWVTTWTFLSHFTDVTPRAFWISAPTWYFCTGGLLMGGWFFSGLLRGHFLYCYVLGHELTHILFIWLFRGRVSDWGVSRDGGYVTTDKSNIVIALAPYFVPLWAALAMLIYAVANFFWAFPPAAEKIVFGATGFLWAFHLLWTLWMIPRDQPDLKENGTLLSLLIIYLINLLLLSGLLCLGSGVSGFRTFGLEWTENAARLHDLVRAWLHQATY